MPYGHQALETILSSCACPQAARRQDVVAELFIEAMTGERHDSEQGKRYSCGGLVNSSSPPNSNSYSRGAQVKSSAPNTTMYRPRCLSNSRNQSLRQATLNRNHSLVHSQLPTPKPGKLQTPDQNPPRQEQKPPNRGRPQNPTHPSDGRTKNPSNSPTETSFDQASSTITKLSSRNCSKKE